MKAAPLSRFAVIALGALSLGACQDISVSSPSTIAPAQAASGKAAADRLRGQGAADNPRNANSATCTDRKPVYSAGVFGPSGGTLIFGNSRLIIPGGALRDTVTISATIADPTSSRVEFRPSGLKFETPAGLLLDTEGCAFSAGDVPSVVYLSEDGLVLETIDAVWDPRWKTFAAAIRHFSGYAIAF